LAHPCSRAYVQTNFKIQRSQSKDDKTKRFKHRTSTLAQTKLIKQREITTKHCVSGANR